MKYLRVLTKHMIIIYLLYISTHKPIYKNKAYVSARVTFDKTSLGPSPKTKQTSQSKDSTYQIVLTRTNHPKNLTLKGNIEGFRSKKRLYIWYYIWKKVRQIVTKCWVNKENGGPRSEYLAKCFIDNWVWYMNVYIEMEPLWPK